MAPLTKQQIDHLKQVMQEREKELLGEIREALARSQEMPQGELADVPDVGDQSVMELLLDLDNSMVQRGVDELRGIETARERMDQGSYGQCIDCGLAIAYERLQASPTAKRCLACQEQYEKTHAHAAAPKL